MKVKILVVSLAILCILLAVIPAQIIHAETGKIYVAIIWHYHQPWYYSPDETYFILPWVRMHSVGNYYKMAYILSKYPEVKVTFTFSGSLLWQLVDYTEYGKADVREIISWRVVNGTVTREDVYNMLKIPGGFFDINWARIVERSSRFRELRDLAQRLHRDCLRIAKTTDELVDCVVRGFTGGNLLNQTVIDLATLFNLLWIDPQVAHEEYYDRIYSLMKRAYSERYPNFKIEELKMVLEVHREIMKKVVPAYRQLVARGQVELIPVPYGHPIAPLLTAFGMEEDLELHVRRSIEVFNTYFNYIPRGVWPAEQAVNEPSVRVFRRAGMTWTVTDSTVLAQTGVDTTSIENLGVPWYIDFPEGRIYVFFRETEISNLISFQYSGWDQDAAVNDLVNSLINYARQAGGPRIVVIALDGENPWEHYPEFGTIFLNKLYSRLTELQRQGVIETITPGEFIDRFSYVAKVLPERNYVYLDLVGKDISDMPKNSYGNAYGDLPRKTVRARLPEGSWGGDLSIWIGHRQENVAWMWLVKAREDIMKAANVARFSELYEKNRAVAEYIMRAQTSCWFWWYGGDGGGSPAPFDPLFKAFLARAYESVGVKPPDYLKVYAYPDGTPRGLVNPAPPALMDKRVVIDGEVEETWRTLVLEGKALEVIVGNIVSLSYVAVDRENVYIALMGRAVKPEEVKITVYFATPSASLSPYKPGYLVYPRNATADLAIYLTREILLDLSTRKANVSVAVNGSWVRKTELDIKATILPDNRFAIEIALNIDMLELARGELSYFAIAVYTRGELVEWSSRLDMAYQLHIPMLPPEVTGKVIFDYIDPMGDDDGAGGFEYPQNPVFIKGVFDLTRFVLIDVGDRLVFKFYFAKLGGNPWGGPNGWSLQQIHVYIKTTLPVEGKLEAIALNFIVEHGWHMALLIGPGWGTDALPKGERTGLYYYDRADPLVQDGYLRAYADPAENAIVVEVLKNVLYDVENVENWVIVVAVTSHDGFGTNRVRTFATARGEWVVYAPPEYALALIKGVLPYVLDLLAKTREDQYVMLRSFNPEAGTLARVRGIGKIVVETTPETPPPQQPQITPESPTPEETTPVTLTPTPSITPESAAPEHYVGYTPLLIAVVAVSIVAITVTLLLRRKRIIGS